MLNSITSDFKKKLEEAVGLVEDQTKVNLSYFLEGLAHVSEGGIYPQEENKLWTASFYPGMTYLAYENTKDEAFMKNRQLYLDSFKERALNGHMVTHDIGFLYMLTYLKDYEVFSDNSSLEIATIAADKLMERYHEDGKFIQAWKEVIGEGEETRIIIDTMMNVEFLFRMAEVTGNKAYYDAAYNHSMISSKTLIREDGSSYHTYYLKKSGEYVGGKTHQGHRDESTWARGQSWAVYGFSQSYLLTGEEEFLKTALKAAKVYIDNLPKDNVHYWDFDFNDENQDIKDSSAASVGAGGLVLLIEALKKSDQNADTSVYEETVIKIMDSLIDNYMIKEVKPGQGILREGMYHRDHGFNEFTSWGDYYFLEALLMLLD